MFFNFVEEEKNLFLKLTLEFSSIKRQIQLASDVLLNLT